MYKIDDYENKSRRLANIQKIIIKIIYIIIVPIIIVNLILLFETKIYPSKIPSILGIKSFVIISKSMEPTINKNDAILVKKTNEKELKENDIITFHEKDYINTHRIIEIKDVEGHKQYRTKGDNNIAVDEEFKTIEDVEGKYLFKISGLGEFVKILKNKLTLVVLLLILILILSFQTRVNKRELERKTKRYNYEKKESK